MAKKRKSEATRLDEVDRTMYASFCTAANSLSQIYTQAMSHQKLAFQAGERHALEKLYQLIMRHNEGVSRVTVADIVAYLQNEIDFGGEDASISLGLSQMPHQHPQSTMHPTSTNIQNTQSIIGQTAIGHAHRTGESDQTKNSIFSNALSSPVRRCLQSYHLAQGGTYYSDNVLTQGNGTKGHELNPQNQIRDSTSLGSSGSSMDMHSDSPVHGPY